jgi:hypothetical protein
MATHHNLLRLTVFFAFFRLYASSILSLGSADNLVAYRNQTGKTFQFTVTGYTGNWITGSDIYTDSSGVSTSAVHAGVVNIGETKIITVTILGGQASYLGTNRNQVGSQSSGAWAGSYWFGNLTSPTSLTAYRSQVGHMFAFLLTGVNSGTPVYGTDIYSDQSNPAAAAVHAGVLLIGQTTIIIVTILAGQSSYCGSARNNITSSSLGTWPGSYSFSQVTTPLNLVNYRNQVGRTFSFLVTGDISNWICGTDIYTDSSAVSTTAVHAGVLNPGDTKIVIVTILAGQPSYLATNRNQIQSQSSGAWAGSYCFGSLSSPTNLTAYRNQVGHMFAFLLTGVNSGTPVYGTDIYSDQSNPAAAAVHAGVLLIGQTTIIIVTILAGQSSYFGSARNNITSSSLGAWSGSYSFAPLTTPSNLVNYRNQVGRTFPFLVTGDISNWIYGSDIYTDISVVSTTAVHAGVINAGETKIITVTVLGGQASYLGTNRNQIQSQTSGAFAGSYWFGNLTSPTNLTAYRSQVGHMFAFLLTGVNSGTPVYGTDIYSDQSNPAAAAVHTGVLLIGQTTIIIVTILAGQSSYIGSARNNITSSSLGVWPGSYSFAPLTTPSNLVNYRCQVGRSFPFLISGDTSNWIYGSDIYPDSSVVSTAAVHAGVLRNGETKILIVNILPGQGSYSGTTRNGVTSYGFANWVCSYSFVNRTIITGCPAY